MTNRASSPSKKGGDSITQTQLNTSWSQSIGRWLGVAKALCILRHRGVQLILAYSWARPAILVGGNGRGEMFYFFCFFTFIYVPLSSLSLSFISCTISLSHFSLSLGDDTKWPQKVQGWRVIKPQHNRSHTIEAYLMYSYLIHMCNWWFKFC